MTGTNSLLHRYPMGPKLRAWLDVKPEDYQGSSNDQPTPAEHNAFTAYLLAHFEDASVSSDSHLVDLLEELVGMNQPLLAIRLVDGYPQFYPQDDFRAQLHLGNACMLVGELLRAEECFRIAQKLVPEEPAPYVNLTQIYAHDGRLGDALVWCQAGLDAEPNNTRLWEMLAWIYQQDQNIESPSAMIRSQAASRNSWAGLSLATDLNTDELDDVRVVKKLNDLESYYNEGLRDHEFLIEYTALLGMAGHYDKIPPIIWQAEKTSSSELPWQLFMHSIQAQLGLGRDDVACELIDKYSKIKTLPPPARSALAAFSEELSLQS